MPTKKPVDIPGMTDGIMEVPDNGWVGLSTVCYVGLSTVCYVGLSTVCYVGSVRKKSWQDATHTASGI
jgi:hypothetical protein